MDDELAKFKAFASEFEAESAYLIPHRGEAKTAFLRIFKDKGGLVRIDLSPSSDHSEHIQIVVGQAQLMKRLADPQEIPDES